MDLAVVGSGIAATSEVLCARVQMALTLAFHVVIASLGVGFPVLMLVAERRWLSTGDPVWRAIARRWSRAFAVLFAVGAVTGTVLSFEIALLWPAFLRSYGSVIGLPFTLETFAFFLEAIFLGIYLYGWDRMSPRAHWWAGVPVAVAGLASALFVVTANAWMNTPAGFALKDGVAVEVDPWAAMSSPAAAPQAVHMAIAAYVTTGFLVAAFYAIRRLRGDTSVHVSRAMALPLVMAAALVPVQAVVGHWAARVVAATQPVKFAALEGQFRTEARAPLRIGGVPDEGAEKTRFAIEVPGGLSWLAHGDPDAVVTGLHDVPPGDRPPVALVHLSFQAMIGASLGLLAIGAWTAVSALARRRLPSSRPYLRAVAAGGVLALVALEAGWFVTEVGRQPWIVQGSMRVADALTEAPLPVPLLVGSTLAYALLGVATVVVLRRLARRPIT